MKQHLTAPIFRIISESADELQTPAYVVGGYVRDLLLKRESKDIDVVVTGNGIALAKEVASRLSNLPRVTVFKTYGTAMLKTGGWEVEFVGARRESYSRNSRNPEVEPGTLTDDQNRRDFTINALALSLQKENFGELLDSFGGLRHLEQKLIKTPGDPDITFSDDPLRMLRAIRFASQLDFTIDPETFDAIVKNAERIEIISRERITVELNKIILSPKPSIGFKLLSDSGLLQIIFPEMMALHGVETINGKSHKDNFYHTLQVLDNICSMTGDLWLRWAAILHDIAKPLTKKFEPGEGWTFHGHEDKGARMVPQIFRRMKLPLNEKMKFVENLVLLHLRPKAIAENEVTDSAVRRLIVDAGEDLESLFILCRADITSKNAARVKKYLGNLDNVEKLILEVAERDRMRNWQPPINGSEIMETFNIVSGKEVGLIKNAIREAILDGKISNDRDEAYELMMQLGKEMGLEPQ